MGGTTALTMTDSSLLLISYTLLHENNAVHQITRNKLMRSQINANSEIGFQNGCLLTRINEIQIFKWHLINASFQFQQNFLFTEIHLNSLLKKTKKIKNNKQISSQSEKTF